MGLPGHSWRGSELKAPVALVIAVLALAAWKVCVLRLKSNRRFFFRVTENNAIFGCVFF